MTYKEELRKIYGITYESFRSWLIKHKGIIISELDEDERHELACEYKETRRMSDFETKYGYSRKSFISWLKNNYGLNYSTLDYEDFMAYISIYQEYRKIQEYSRQDITEILKKYIVASSEGSYIELDESEMELVELLESKI